jgi:crossover junction endodeoxyribonuclease RuvC
MKDGFCILGVDPGASGAIAFYFPAYPDRIMVEDVPIADGHLDATTLSRRIAQLKPDLAIIELVGAMPKQGLSSTFKFGVSFGKLQGIVAAQQIPSHFVTPQKWKKHFGLSADKEQARARALILWPSCDGFALKKSHGRAEAALLAKYGAEVVVRRNAEAAE